jgi:hypothetical protein
VTSSLVAVVLVAVLSTEAADELTGTWRRGDAERGGGSLLLRQDGTSLRFQLELWRGAPSYNSGWVGGRITHANGLRRLVLADEPQCRIVATVSGSRATITQEGTDCGFGHAVYASGVYRRIDRKPPVFVTREGETSK